MVTLNLRLLAGLAVLALLAPQTYAGGSTDPLQVKIGNFSFLPATITVPVGAHLVWINQDDVPHVVVGTDANSPIKSPALDTDDRYEVTLTHPGTYAYFCSLHPHMVGTVIVR
ncbi:MAG: cupredoxin family copper-binding protein [Povalibacter sp.]